MSYAASLRAQVGPAAPALPQPAQDTSRQTTARSAQMWSACGSMAPAGRGEQQPAARHSNMLNELEAQQQLLPLHPAAGAYT
jgi:hypothetical protein